MVNNNVFILFEEIRNIFCGTKSKLEELPKVVNGQQPIGNNKQELSHIKYRVTEVIKNNPEQIKDLLAQQWEVYVQISNANFNQMSFFEEQLEESKIDQLLEKYIRRHSSDIKTSKVFSFVVGMVLVCAICCWGNIEQWKFKQLNADDVVKFHVIRVWGGWTADDVLSLDEAFNIHHNEDAIEWVRRQADEYKNFSKTVSDSFMQKGLLNMILK